MVKLRNAYFCNLKLILIFLVIFGHAIEQDPNWHPIYRAIYLFHIPLFAFVSGLFAKSPTGCIRQLKRLLPVYLCCQSAAVILGLARWHTPWWVLWYLLSMCFWLGTAALLMRWKRGGRWILVLALALGCLAGRVSWLGRWMSLSRTIVFFPYFWLGTLLPRDLPWHRLRLPSLLALPLLGVGIPAATLYQAGPCDPKIRLVCYLCAAALSVLVLSWCPRRRFPWTKAGADTMSAYLLHAPLVRLLPDIVHPIAFTVIFLYLITQANRWRSAIGIIGKEEAPWPDLKTSITSTASRFTGSSWP